MRMPAPRQMHDKTTLLLLRTSPCPFATIAPNPQLESRMEKTATADRNIAVINEDGDIFPSMEALQSWEAWVNAKLTAAEKSPPLSHQEAIHILAQAEAYAR